MATGAGWAQQNDTIYFGEFELDLSAQTLLQGGVPVKLQRQPFEVLELLVKRAPAMVSREEIRRLALGDTSAGARFVETLPRPGYRFVAPVEGAREKTFIPEPPPIEKARPTLSSRRLIPGLAVFVALTTLLCWWGWLLQRSTVSGVARISPITTFPG